MAPSASPLLFLLLVVVVGVRAQQCQECLLLPELAGPADPLAGQYQLLPGAYLHLHLCPGEPAVKMK